MPFETQQGYRRKRCAAWAAASASLLLAAVGLATGSAHGQAGGAGGARRGTADVAAVAQMIAARTNAFRAENRVAALERNRELDAAAQEFAEYMARTGRYGHTADGKEPSERIVEHGYSYCGTAENIAYVYRSQGYTASELAETFVQGWIDSPPHRANMLDANLTQIGVGVARSPKTGYYYGVQDFGRPKSATIEFSVENQSTVSARYSLGDQSFTLPARAVRTHRICRAQTLDFASPGRRGKSGLTRFTPETGDRFLVTGTKGAVRIMRRQPAASARR
ncbi:MAG TPA: CAP domain-containing protein [Gammaproteobacteria bacterium]|nr:CAP domain-containing protein [Gammaproteobacteria bacterium]